ncbi:MAG TPA: tetratricopeptide repeat protein, partial [Candidatus Limnocylindria bacterium]|nr:tetratricopeptide repeat protein [Candidatus Limnocylindria bacterium]
WTALRQDHDEEARREFLEFVRLHPQDPNAPDALLLAAELAPLVATAPSTETRATALLLQAEAAYHAGTYAAASAAFRRALVEFPGHPLAGAARLGVAWTALRQDHDEEARREFLEFVRRDPKDPQAADALLLAAELALKAPPAWSQAKALLDRIVTEYPTRPRTEFAKLNRAILLLRTGDLKGAQVELSDWIARAPFAPLLGRAHAALGAALLAAGLPGAAEKAFAQAQRDGLGALATLGLGSAQLAQGKPDVAKGLFEDARDHGTPAIAHAAEYGLAAAAFEGGAHKELKQPALAELDAAPKGRRAPRLLYVLTGIAVEEKDWAGALGFAKRLANEFAADEAADDAFETIGAGATQAAAWPVVYEAYGELRQRYPKSPFADAAVVALAEAQLETGRTDAARQALEKLVTSAPADAKLGRAWLLLARARAATRDRAGAIDAYARAAKEGRVPEWGKREILNYARLLAEDKRPGEARAILSEFLRRADAADAADAAYALGETYRSEGDFPAAVEYFMTAAYVAPESAPGRRALLGAAASLVALKQPDSAAIVYKKLLEQPQVPSELADAARRGLKEIAR